MTDHAIDFSGVADVDPYTNGDLTYLQGSERNKIVSGELVPITVGRMVKLGFTQAAPDYAGDVSAEIVIGSTIKNMGPAMLVGSGADIGKGYILECRHAGGGLYAFQIRRFDLTEGLTSDWNGLYPDYNDYTVVSGDKIKLTLHANGTMTGYLNGVPLLSIQNKPVTIYTEDLIPATCQYKDSASSYAAITEFNVFGITSGVVADPADPTNLVATAQSDNKITLAWDAATNAQLYIVSRSPDGSTGWEDIGETARTELSSNDLSMNTQYFYRVVASDGTTLSSPSNTDSATTYNPVMLRQLYVSPTGDDSNDGTEGSPKRFVTPLLDVAIPGDVINLLPGTYTEEVGGVGQDSTDMFWSVSGVVGTPTNPVWMRANPGDEGLVIFDGNYTKGLATISGDSKHIKFRNIVAKRLRRWGIISNADLTAPDYYVEDMDTSATFIDIQSCVFLDIRNPNSWGYNCAAVRTNGNTDWLVVNNIVDSVVQQNGSNPDDGYTTLNCTGVKTYRTKDWVVRNNTFLNVVMGVGMKANWTYNDGSAVDQCADVCYNFDMPRTADFWAINSVPIYGHCSFHWFGTEAYGRPPTGHIRCHHNMGIGEYGKMASAAYAVNSPQDGIPGPSRQNGTVRFENNSYYAIGGFGTDYNSSTLLQGSRVRMATTGNILSNFLGREMSASDDRSIGEGLIESDYNVYDFQNPEGHNYKVKWRLDGVNLSLSQWQAQTIGGSLAVDNPDTNSVEEIGSVTFTDPNNYDLTLKAGSAAIGLMPGGSNAGCYQYGTEVIGARITWFDLRTIWTQCPNWLNPYAGPVTPVVLGAITATPASSDCEVVLSPDKSGGLYYASARSTADGAFDNSDIDYLKLGNGVWAESGPSGSIPMKLLANGLDNLTGYHVGVMVDNGTDSNVVSAAFTTLDYIDGIGGAEVPADDVRVGDLYPNIVTGALAAWDGTAWVPAATRALWLNVDNRPPDSSILNENVLYAGLSDAPPQSAIYNDQQSYSEIVGLKPSINATQSGARGLCWDPGMDLSAQYGIDNYFPTNYGTSTSMAGGKNNTPTVALTVAAGNQAIGSQSIPAKTGDRFFSSCLLQLSESGISSGVVLYAEERDKDDAYLRGHEVTASINTNWQTMTLPVTVLESTCEKIVFAVVAYGTVTTGLVVIDSFDFWPLAEKISADNIGSYVENLAIQNAQMGDASVDNLTVDGSAVFLPSYEAYGEQATYVPISYPSGETAQSDKWTELASFNYDMSGKHPGQTLIIHSVSCGGLYLKFDDTQSGVKLDIILTVNDNLVGYVYAADSIFGYSSSVTAGVEYLEGNIFSLGGTGTGLGGRAGTIQLKDGAYQTPIDGNNVIKLLFRITTDNYTARNGDYKFNSATLITCGGGS